MLVLPVTFSHAGLPCGRCDRHRQRVLGWGCCKTHPAVVASVFRGEQKTTLYLGIFILLLLEKCSCMLSISCRSEPTLWLLVLGFIGPLRQSVTAALPNPSAAGGSPRAELTPLSAYPLCRPTSLSSLEDKGEPWVAEAGSCATCNNFAPVP